MITCSRKIQFCAGHRVVGHENKCANVHGHNYLVIVTAQAEDLDKIGRVIDFSVLKEKIGGWIDQFWDHTFISAPNESADLIRVVTDVNNKPVFFLGLNPTAENIAEYLLRVVCPSVLADSGVTVKEVIVWETANCHATARA